MSKLQSALVVLALLSIAAVNSAHAKSAKNYLACYDAIKDIRILDDGDHNEAFFYCHEGKKSSRIDLAVIPTEKRVYILTESSSYAFPHTKYTVDMYDLSQLNDSEPVKKFCNNKPKYVQIMKDGEDEEIDGRLVLTGPGKIYYIRNSRIDPTDKRYLVKMESDIWDDSVRKDIGHVLAERLRLIPNVYPKMKTDYETKVARRNAFLKLRKMLMDKDPTCDPLAPDAREAVSSKCQNVSREDFGLFIDLINADSDHRGEFRNEIRPLKSVKEIKVIAETCAKNTQNSELKAVAKELKKYKAD